LKTVRRCGALLASCLVLLLCGLRTNAQDFPFDEFTHVRDGLPADPNTWTSTDYTTYTKRYGALMVDIVWLYAHPDREKPQIHTDMGARRFPPNQQGSSITFSASYLQLTTQLGFLLGHDIYASQVHKLDIPEPILNRPFATGSLLQAEDPLVLFLQNRFFEDHAQLTMCPQSAKQCLIVQALSLAGIQLFLTAHECAHYLLGHSADDRGPEKEKIADEFASGVMDSVAKSFATPQDNDQLYQLIFAAGPIAILSFEIQTKELGNSGTTEQMLRDRRDILLNKHDDLNSTISDLMPDELRSTRFTKVTFSWDQQPAAIYIEGVRVDPAEASARPLILPAKYLHVAAVCASGIAFATLPGGDDSAALELHFSAFSDLSSAQIQTLVSQKKWEQALLATSKNGLAPRSSEVAAPYLKAMYYLHLGPLINPDDPSLAQVRTDAEHYRGIRSALRGWGIN